MHALRLLVDGGREERPHLPEEDRQDDRDRGVEADLERRRERLRHAERDERLVVGEQAHQPLDQLVVEHEGERERGHDRDDADEEPVPELRQVLDEGRFLVVARGAAADPAGHRAREVLGDGVALARGASRSADAAARGRRQLRERRRTASSSLPDTESLNSRIPLPSWRPISGSRFGPKTRSSTSSRIRSSQMPIPKGMARSVAASAARRGRDGTP